MNLLIGMAGWIDVTDDESISFYMPLTLSLFSPCIYRLIKNFPFNFFFQLVFFRIFLFFAKIETSVNALETYV